MGSFEKKQLYSNVNNPLPVESYSLQTPVLPLPSISDAFTLNCGENSPVYFRADSCHGLQNQVKDNGVPSPAIHTGQLQSGPPPIAYMRTASGVQQAEWSTSPLATQGPSFSSPEASENRNICNLNLGADLYSPSVILPPLTPRSFGNSQQFASNAQSNSAFAFPIQPQITMEGTVNSPKSTDICVQGFMATPNYEATLTGGYAGMVSTSNGGGLAASNSTNMITSLPNCSSPEGLASHHDSKQGRHSQLLSVKERFPDLWKYGGLDGRFSSHRKDNIDLETLKSHFHLPMVEASKKLGVCVTVLKKICRRFGISRWPHRKLRSVAKHIEKHEKAFHKGYSDHFSYDEVLELCRKNPEKFSNSSKNCGLYRNQDMTSSGSSKLSSRSFNVSSAEYAESLPSGVDESPEELNKESISDATRTTSEGDQI
ncbi:hypothetical protein Gasu2_58670 [Galdieria sulphuraria]|nr:hypothetical protein Gasu2_58670 [Galdieria sulphuraria]